MITLKYTTREQLKMQFPKIIFPSNLYIDLLEPEIHTSDERYYNNLVNENELYRILNRNKNDLFSQTPRYCEFDFISETENANIFIELKSRHIKLHAFKSTIFPISKIKYYLELRKLNNSSNNILILVFSFNDDIGNNIYYYIQYNKCIFEKYKTMTLPNGIYYNIPINELKPLDNLSIIK
jgi:hypothetical protein